MRNRKPLTWSFWLLIGAIVVANVALAAPPQSPLSSEDNSTWFSITPSGTLQLHLYFFWSKKCPHCLEALPFVRRLQTEHEWLQVHSLELTDYPQHVEQYIVMATQLGQDARSVPAFLWCGQMRVGYDNEQGMGQILLQQLQHCREQLLVQGNPHLSGVPVAAAEPQITLPMLGKLDLQRYSLPAYTVILAGLDAFNPCAFFVLLFLLSLLVHAKQRGKMLLIGGIFVFFSGLLYFLFMAAWLNLFLLIGQINAITYVAGGVAMSFALINIKDFFWFKKGVSLSIPEGSKPGLFAHMRKLVNSDNTTAMVLAAAGLAAFANLYEFLCTAGFPMVYTRILTLNELSPTAYYFYLTFYNVVYVLPLLLITVVFSLTLGARKLQERHGKVLKLMSGLMMLGLGLVLLLEPNWLNNAGVAVFMLGAAVAATYLISTLERRLVHRLPSK